MRRISSEDGRFVLDVEGRTITADQVVVATGPFQTPYVPEFAKDLDPDLWQAHSTGYRRPSDVPEGTVLVVGGGNHRLPDRQGALGGAQGDPLGRHSSEAAAAAPGRPRPFWGLTRTGLIHKTVESRLGQRLKDRDTLIGSSPRELRRRYGVELKPRVIAASGRTVRFEDGGEVEADAVIWATGYRPDYAWIDLPILDPDGRLRHRRGVIDVPGLCFLGLTWQHTRGSALIGWVKDDAEFIAERVAALQEAKARAAPANEEADVRAGAPAREG